MIRHLLAFSCVSAMATGAVRAADHSHWGRDIENRNTASLGVIGGLVESIYGSVQETTRRFYEVTGQPQKQAYAEDYSLEELGFDESYPTFGLAFEKMWKYVTLQLNASYMNPTADAAAERDYYIGVEEVSFGGETYEYLVIPKGREYTADIQAGLIGARGLVTPFTLEPPAVAAEMTPWIYLGLASFIGYYDIDAGPASSVVEYEFQPRPYVVGGTGKGLTGLAVPELGFGGEVRLWQASRRGREVALLLQGYYSLFQFEGSTDDLGASSRNEKLIDLDYENFEIRLVLEVPMSANVDFFAGVA